MRLLLDVFLAYAFVCHVAAFTVGQTNQDPIQREIGSSEPPSFGYVASTSRRKQAAVTSTPAPRKVASDAQSLDRYEIKKTLDRQKAAPKRGRGRRTEAGVKQPQRATTSPTSSSSAVRVSTQANSKLRPETFTTTLQRRGPYSKMKDRRRFPKSRSSASGNKEAPTDGAEPRENTPGGDEVKDDDEKDDEPKSTGNKAKSKKAPSDQTDKDAKEDDGEQKKREHKSFDDPGMIVGIILAAIATTAAPLVLCFYCGCVSCIGSRESFPAKAATDSDDDRINRQSDRSSNTCKRVSLDCSNALGLNTTQNFRLNYYTDTNSSGSSYVSSSECSNV